MAGLFIFLAFGYCVARGCEVAHRWNWSRILAIIVLIYAAMNTLKHDEYLFLRFIVSAVSVHTAYKAAAQQESGWAWGMAILATLFNPFYPIHLEHDTWCTLDWIGAVIIGVSLKNEIGRTGIKTDDTGAQSKQSSDMEEVSTKKASTKQVSNGWTQSETWLSSSSNTKPVGPEAANPCKPSQSQMTANETKVNDHRPMQTPQVVKIDTTPPMPIDCSPQRTSTLTTTPQTIPACGLNKVQEFGEIIDIFRTHGFNVDIGILEPWATEEAIFQNIKLTHSQHVAAEEAYGQYTPDEILDSDYTPELSAENREAVAYQKKLHDDIVRTMNEWHDNVRRQVADGKEIRERRLGRALRAMKVMHGEAPHPNSHEADLLALGEQVRKFSRHTIRFSSDSNVRQVLSKFIEGEHTSIPGASDLSNKRDRWSAQQSH